EVDLGERDDLRALGQRLVVARELAVDGVEVLLRLAVRLDRKLDEVKEDPRPLDMPEEAVAEAGAFGGALDEAGDVGEDEAPAARQPDDAEVRRQRRERIVGDLRARPRHRREERGLADVGVAEEARVGEELELEAEGLRLAGRSGLGRPRRLVPRRLE